MRRPQQEDRALPETVRLRLIEVREVKPPADVELLHWRLLTTHDIADAAGARQIVGWHQLRWGIDIDQAWRLSRISGVAVGLCKRWRPAVPRGRRRSDSLQCADRLRIGLHQFSATNAGLHHAAA